jgi:hypothetical protein
MICSLLLVTVLSLNCDAFLLSEQSKERPISSLSNVMDQSRRRMIAWLPSAAIFAPNIVFAAEETSPFLVMKEFVDPMGLFYIQIPSSFYTLRRSTKGDLPDGNGQGRRGSSIFTAGNMAKAEIIAVER